jgi:hypothetical protein
MKTKMDFSTQYILDALKTESSLSPLKENDLISDRVLHACIGITTEAGELVKAVRQSKVVEDKQVFDTVNLMEECGDIYWYLAILYKDIQQSFSHKIPQKDKNSIPDDVMDIAVITTEMLDVCKKGLFYGKIKIPLLNYKEELEQKVVNLLDKCGYDMEYTMKVNIDKLKARYPQKFSTEKAHTRDLDKERSILEGGK